MTTYSQNNKRIAKNTMILYFRMFLTMGISLFTSRVILNTLGIEEYGIYSAVGGIVTIFSFFNASMTSSTQRFLTFELGNGSFEKLNKIFNTSISIHFVLSIVVILLSATVGFWFLKTQMTIPPDRMTAAVWVYIFSILSSVILIISIPYNAIIIAHEKMSAFAYISILEVTLKLLIVYLLLFFDTDKLILYSFLILLVQLLIRLIYGIYCKKHFPETKFKLSKDKVLYKEMIGFAGWSLFGNLAHVTFTQGLNLLLNIFFGPIINAARGIAVQVQNTVNSFAVNFQTAINPQITKSYASGDFNYLYSLIYRSSKFSFFLLFLISLPIFIEAETILKLWLKVVPENTALFLRLILCTTLIDAVANPLMRAADATGKIKRYHSIIGSILLLILPISYIVLKLGGAPHSVFVVHLVICCIAFIVRLFIVRSLIQLSIKTYFTKVLLRIFCVTILSLPFPFLLFHIVEDGILSCLFICILSVFCVALSTYLFGLNHAEKLFMIENIKKLFYKQK